MSEKKSSAAKISCDWYNDHRSDDDKIQGIICLVALHPVKILYLSNHKTIIFTSIMRI